MPWGQAHIFSSLGAPARLNTYSRFPLGTENLLVWSQSKSGFSCLDPIAFSKVATHFPNVLGLKDRALHDISARPIGPAWRICSKSHSAVISEFLLRSYKAVTDLPVAMGLTNISLPISIENLIWFRFKELIREGFFFLRQEKKIRCRIRNIKCWAHYILPRFGWYMTVSELLLITSCII